tara:strand:- start:33166 stop:40146 length:6981 start_codon:yes stop_codon:yes gene_type:complete
VSFKHPGTGEQRTGAVSGTGPKGATVVDHESGESHKVPHGHWKHDAGAPSKQPDQPRAEPEKTEEPAAESWTPAKRTAKTDAHPKAMAMAKRIFGQEVTPEHLAAIGGVPPDVDVTISTGMDAGVVIIAGTWADHPDSDMTRVLRRGEDSKGPTIENVYFELEAEQQGQGLGAQALLRQVQAAGEMGVSGIQTEAAGSADDEDGMVGYYVWPRLGYDGDLPQAAQKATGQKRLSDLMKSSKGRDWWKQNGHGVKVEFDPSKGSLGRRVLSAYAEAKGYDALAKAVQTALFGDPGDKTEIMRETFDQELEEDDLDESLDDLAKGVDQIPGGKADKRKPSDFDPDELAEGIEHEMEHTDDRSLAREIAMDHLAEHAHYYTRLQKLEKGRKDQKRDKAGRWEKAPQLGEDDNKTLDDIWDKIGGEDKPEAKPMAKGTRLVALRKAVDHPLGTGWGVIPGGNKGGYRRRKGQGWEYWYKGNYEAGQAEEHHKDAAAHHHAEHAKYKKLVENGGPDFLRNSMSIHAEQAGQHTEHAEHARAFNERTGADNDRGNRRDGDLEPNPAHRGKRTLGADEGKIWTTVADLMRSAGLDQAMTQGDRAGKVMWHPKKADEPRTPELIHVRHVSGQRHSIRVKMEPSDGYSGHVQSYQIGLNTKTPESIPYEIVLRVPAGTWIDQNTMSMHMRRVLAHEVAHAMDELSSSHRKRDVTKYKEGGAHYYNDPAEIVAFRHNLFRELNTPEAADAVQQHLTTWERDEEEAASQREWRKEEGKTTLGVRPGKHLSAHGAMTILERHSDTWNRVEKHLTPANRRKMVDTAVMVLQGHAHGSSTPMAKGARLFIDIGNLMLGLVGLNKGGTVKAHIRQTAKGMVQVKEHQRTVKPGHVKPGATWSTKQGRVRVHSIKGDTAYLHREHEAGSGNYGSKFHMPAASVPQHVHDLNDHLPHPATANHPAVNNVLRGKGSKIGKGNDGIVHDAGDGKHVVKVSSTTPYHPENSFQRSPEDAVAHLRKEHTAHTALHGLSMVQDIHGEEHDGRYWLTKPHLSEVGKMSKAELDEVKSNLEQMHAKGWTTNDELQLGRNAEGKLKFMDLGQASHWDGYHTPDGLKLHADDDPRRTDLQRLGWMYQAHGEKMRPTGAALRGQEQLAYMKIKRLATTGKLEQARKAAFAWQQLSSDVGSEILDEDGDEVNDDVWDRYIAHTKRESALEDMLKARRKESTSDLRRAGQVALPLGFGGMTARRDVGKQHGVKQHVRRTKTGLVAVKQHQRKGAGHQARAPGTPVRGVVSDTDRHVAAQIIDFEKGEAAHKRISEALQHAHDELVKWDRSVGFKRIDRKKRAAELESIMGQVLDIIGDEDEEPIEYLGLKMETQGASLIEHGFNKIHHAFKYREKGLHDKADAPHFKSEMRRTRGLRLEHGAVDDMRLHTEYSWKGHERDQLRAELAQQLADVGTLPATHHELFRSAGTMVRHLISGTGGIDQASATAGVDRTTKRPIVTMYRGSIKRGSASDDLEDNAVLLHELGHIVDQTVSRRMRGMDDQSVADEFAHVVTPDAVGNVGQRALGGDHWEDQKHRTWQKDHGEWLAEAYRYAFADGGKMETTLQSGDFDLGAARAWFNSLVGKALDAGPVNLNKARRPSRKALEDAGQLGFLGGGAGQRATVKTHVRKTKTGLVQVKQHDRGTKKKAVTPSKPMPPAPPDEKAEPQEDPARMRAMGAMSAARHRDLEDRGWQFTDGDISKSDRTHGLTSSQVDRLKASGVAMERRPRLKLTRDDKESKLGAANNLDYHVERATRKGNLEGAETMRKRAAFLRAEVESGEHSDKYERLNPFVPVDLRKEQAKAERKAAKERAAKEEAIAEEAREAKRKKRAKPLSVVVDKVNEANAPPGGWTDDDLVPVPEKPVSKRAQNKLDKAHAQRVHAAIKEYTDWMKSERLPQMGPRATFIMNVGSTANRLQAGLGGPADRREADRVIGEIAKRIKPKPAMWDKKPKPTSEPWEMSRRQYLDSIGVRERHIAEISGVQRQRMSGRARRAYSAERRADRDAADAGSDVWRKSVMDAQERGDKLHADAAKHVKSERSRVSIAATAEAGSKLAATFYSARGNYFDESNKPKIGQKVRTQFGSLGTVTKVSKKSIRMKSEYGGDQKVRLSAVGLPEDEALTHALSTLNEDELGRVAALGADFGQKFTQHTFKWKDEAIAEQARRKAPAAATAPAGAAAQLDAIEAEIGSMIKHYGLDPNDVDGAAFDIHEYADLDEAMTRRDNLALDVADAAAAAVRSGTTLDDTAVRRMKKADLDAAGSNAAVGGADHTLVQNEIVRRQEKRAAKLVARKRR